MLIVFIVFYFLVTIAIGYYASSKISNTSDFINAGRNLHPAINTAALFALWFGSETIFGASAEFAEHGLIGVIEDPLGGVLCLLIVGFVLAKKMYRLNMFTIGDLFRAKYGKRVEFISSILMVLSFIGYAGAQIVALGLLCQSLIGLSLLLSMSLSLLIVMTYTFTGGMWAVSITDFIQSILIIIGLIAIAWFMTDQVGSISEVLSSMTEKQKTILPDNNPTSWLNWLAAWMVLGFGSLASQDIFQRVNSARSEDAAFYSTIFGAIFYLIFSLIPLYLIIAIQHSSPELLNGDLQLVLPQLVLTSMPQWVQILFFGSLLSAIMSTCSGALLAPASLLSENLIKPSFRNEISDTQLLKLTRYSVVLIGLISLGIAMSSQNIFELVGQASIFGAVSILVPFVAALIFNHQDSLGAILSMSFGSLTWVVFNFFIPISINPILPGLIASIFGLWVGSQLITKAIINKFKLLY